MGSEYKKDIYLLGSIRAMRSFSFGYIAFILPLYLRYIGFSVELVGLYSLISTISSSILVLISGYLGDVFSRKKTLIIISMLPIIAYIILISTHNIIIALISSLFGLSLSPMGGGAGGGPVAPLQTAMVASRTNRKERTYIYSYLTITAIIMALLGGIFSSLIINTFPKSYYMILFETAIVLSTISIFLIIPIKETPDKIQKSGNKGFIPRKSAKNISKIAITGLFGSLGLGMILPLLPIYFKDIGATDYIISIIYDFSYLATVFVMIFSGKIERNLGSIKGIFILRTLGSLPLAIIPLIHSLFIASLIYILRTASYQAALPIRQNISMELYSPDERSRGSSITGVARRLPYGVSSLLGSILLQIGAYIFVFSSAALISFLDPLFYYIFFKEIDKNDKVNE
ncbi:arabinose efflux permease family protein [Caldisphaera lagunensis DSM 15908]|uniref:Arabinose efflux permease family protein n=1 Tax=Caldisphaera lagunensis (strain DSM 15908 / JCM 11604 / ANMR 0165 / IC-154) TaxID=1056495 RepID=L0A9H1_CALLD|nr:MFS transporter [Caldisphaera lagunensis]AFZ70516.1 arabinose efflux permease family protein [Caldisphaera lagunensis DSM 15908]